MIILIIFGILIWITLLVLGVYLSKNKNYWGLLVMFIPLNILGLLISFIIIRNEEQKEKRIKISV